MAKDSKVLQGLCRSFPHLPGGISALNDRLWNGSRCTSPRPRARDLAGFESQPCSCVAVCPLWVRIVPASELWWLVAGQRMLEDRLVRSTCWAQTVVTWQTGPALSSSVRNSAKTHQPLTQYQRKDFERADVWLQWLPMAHEQEPGVQTAVQAWGVEGRKARVGPSCSRCHGGMLSTGCTQG